jgi:hypothetical protein
MTPIRSEAPENTTVVPASESCSGKIDPTAPAGSKNSLGAKSDCNGRPTTGDGVVEAKDEQPPIPTPLISEDRRA